MDEELRDLMATILQGVVLNERSAREMAALSRLCDADNDGLGADMFLSLSRHHQVKVIEGRAKLAALTDQYIRNFNDDDT